MLFKEGVSPAISAAMPEITTAIILLFITGCEFFLNYRIVFNENRKPKTDKEGTAK